MWVAYYLRRWTTVVAASVRLLLLGFGADWVRALPYRHRIVVYLADLEGLGYDQVSALTGIPLGSVKSCLHRARYRLRAELGTYTSGG